MAIINCECGSTMFNVTEVYTYIGKIDSDGDLICRNCNGGVSNINCVVCGNEYKPEDFSEIIV